MGGLDESAELSDSCSMRCGVGDGWMQSADPNDSDGIGPCDASANGEC